MKNFYLILKLLVVLVFLIFPPIPSDAISHISLSVSPETAEVGEKISYNLTFTVKNLPAVNPNYFGWNGSFFAVSGDKKKSITYLVQPSVDDLYTIKGGTIIEKKGSTFKFTVPFTNNDIGVWKGRIVTNDEQLSNFITFSIVTKGSSGGVCDLKDVIFEPSLTQPQNYWTRDQYNKKTFSVTLVGNENCKGQTWNEVALVNNGSALGENDIGSLNDVPVTFDSNSTRIKFTFLVGEEACTAFPTLNDCILFMRVKTPSGTIESLGAFVQTVFPNGVLRYECDEKFRTCDNTNYPIELVKAEGGGIGQEPSAPPISTVAPREGGTGGGPGGGPGGGLGGAPRVPGAPLSFRFEIPPPIKAESFTDLVKAIGKFIFDISIPIAVVLIIYSGILFFYSQGEKEKVAKAKKTLLYTLVGLLIILIGRGFVTLIRSVLDLGK